MDTSDVQISSLCEIAWTESLGLDVAVDAAYEEGWRWIEIAIPDARTRILLTKADWARARETPALVLDVEDVDTVHETLVERGVGFDQEPRPAPWNSAMRFALFRDSEHNLIMIGS